MYTSPTLTNANIKSIIFNTIITTRHRFSLKEKKINKFIMLRLSKAMKNEVMRIKIVYFGIHGKNSIAVRPIPVYSVSTHAV